MIETAILFTCRMAGIAGRTAERIALDAGMFGICLGLDMLMAVDAAENPVIALVGMTFGALYSGMLSGTYREIFGIMVNGPGYPGVLVMTIGTFCRKLGGSVRRIAGLVVIGLMTAHAGLGSLVVIPVMAAVAVGRHMGSLDHIIAVMNGEGGRFPAGYGGMTVRAGLGYLGRTMIRVGSGIVIRQMAGRTFGGQL